MSCGAGIAKVLLGKAVVPDELSFVTGAIGLVQARAQLHVVGAAGDPHRWRMVQQAARQVWAGLTAK